MPDAEYKQNKDRSDNIHKKIQWSSKVVLDAETKALSHSKRMKISVPENRNIKDNK